MVLIVVLKIDYGPMKLHEDNAVKGDIYTTPDRPYANAENEIVEEKGKVIDLVFPIVVLIISASAVCFIQEASLVEQALLKHFRQVMHR